MATGYLSPIGMIVQLLSDQGVVGNGFQIYTYVAGSVNTPVTTYTASNLVTPNANPLVMGPNGRFQSVSVWAPQGTVIKMVITDQNNSPIAGGTIDNIPLINDINAILATFANPAGGSGVDLVANALKSYAVVANVQASAVPTIAAGQTLIIMVEGLTSVGDGLGGVYYWSGTSTAADDGGITTISPTGSPTTGRYLRLWGVQAGTFTGTLSGFTTTVTGTFNYVRSNGLVNLYFLGTNPQLTGTSNAASMNLSGFPASIIPSNALQDGANGGYCNVVDNAIPQLGICSWGGSNLLNFFVMKINTGTGAQTPTAFTGSGTKSLGTFNIMYHLN